MLEAGGEGRNISLLNVQPRTGDHPAFCPMVTEGLSQEVKQLAKMKNSGAISPLPPYLN
jgi:hypothetical protein